MSSKSINNSKIMSKKKSIAYKILICALFSVIGIVLIIVYAILNRRYRTYDRQYY